jgi:hypothetical protein
MKPRSCFWSLSLLTLLLAVAASEVFVEEIGETETISIDEPTHDEKFVDTNVDNGAERKRSDAASRTKRATDYSSSEGEAYEEEEEENTQEGSGSESTYEDEVSLALQSAT